MISSNHVCKKCKGRKIETSYDSDEDRNLFQCLDCGKAWTAPTADKNISDIRGEMSRRGSNVE